MFPLQSCSINLLEKATSYNVTRLLRYFHPEGYVNDPSPRTHLHFIIGLETLHIFD
jgi:hypothetical protein